MLSEKCDGLPVVGHDGCWNVLRGGWRSDDAPVECAVPESPGYVCGNDDVESVIGDWDGCSVGGVMPQVIGVDVHVVGESGQSGSWDGNVVDQNVVRGLSEKCDGHGRKVVVWVADVVNMDCEVVGLWHESERVEVGDEVLERVVVERVDQ